MAGLSSNGFSIKRLAEVISDRQASARNYFGNDAAVGVNDVLGRALRIHSPAEADLWELAEAVYNSFNPAVATGNQLDAIVSYAGLTRFEAAPSTATLLVTGDYGATIPDGSEVLSSSTQFVYKTTEQVSLGSTGVSGAVISAISAVSGQTYRVDIGTTVVSYSAAPSDSTANVAAELSSAVDATQGYSSQVDVEDTSKFSIEFDDPYLVKNISVNPGVIISSVSKVVTAESEENIDTSQPVGTIDTISSLEAGWTSVTNIEASVDGRNKETDEELRVRFANSKEVNAKGTIDAIYSNLLQVSGVEEVQVYENDTSSTDAQGIPAHSFSAVVLGGSAADIAQVLWETKPAGIMAYGNSSVSVTDSQGIPHVIGFSRPVDVVPIMEIAVSQAEGESLPSDFEDQIKESLAEYISSNFGVGDDLIYSRLFIPIQSVEGVQIDSLVIGTQQGSLSSTNITVAFDEIISYAQSSVSINN